MKGATLITVCVLAITSCLVSAVGNGNCYMTAGGQFQLCHVAGDEGMYFQTPTLRVAYNTQIVKMPDNMTYYTVFHSESMDGFERGVERAGDSIRVGVEGGGFNYLMPDSNYVIWGSTTDTLSLLYYGTDSVSGGGNPMLVSGRTWAGDDYYYLFFLCVYGGSDPNWRHYLTQARTLDFVNYDIFSMDPNGNPTWEPFTQASVYWQQRPLNIQDVDGNGITGMFSDASDATQGLIGSINVVNDVYYYFYCDWDPTKSFMNLYVRTAGDVSQGWKSWSAPQVVNNAPFPVGTVVRAAQAKDMDRWVVLYNCVAPGASWGDLCMQYTENLNVIGPGGISDIQFFDDNQGGHSSYFMGLASVACPPTNPIRAQHYFMTDIYGNLQSPNEEPETTRGGIVTWTDYSCTGNVYGAPVYRAGWQIAYA